MSILIIQTISIHLKFTYGTCVLSCEPISDTVFMEKMNTR